MRDVIATCLQSAPFCSHLGTSAKLPCRACYASKEDLFDPDYDIVANQRRQSHHDAFLVSIEGKSDAEKKEACTKTGWRAEMSPFAGIQFDAPRQTPAEPYHLLLENIWKPLVLGIFQKVLTENAQRLVEDRFRALDYPRGMPKVPFPFYSKLPQRFGMMQVQGFHCLPLMRMVLSCSFTQCLSLPRTSFMEC